MTLLASHINMTSRQREVAELVIEVGILPIGWVMTGGAIRAVCAVVFIVLLMTGVTISRRASKDLVLMAGLTSHFGMFAFQLEDRKIVIEFGGCPTVLRMTIHATKSITTVVRLVPLMAGIAILQRHLKITQPTRIHMTLHAWQTHMLTDELERELVVIKICNKAVCAVMTIETSGTK